MAVTMRLMSLIVASCGIVSFVFGVIAENKKPASGTKILGKDVVICKYPSDPTVVLGYLSLGFLIVTTVAGYLSLFYPYKGKSIPQRALFRSGSFAVFFNIAVQGKVMDVNKHIFAASNCQTMGKACSMPAPTHRNPYKEMRKFLVLGWMRGLALPLQDCWVREFTSGLAAALLLWPVITEQIHQARNVHHNLNASCPTAKTGLLGGGAFLSLDSSLFWLVCLMLADNAREDYFDETGKEGVGEQGQVFIDDFNTGLPAKGSV
ncbi:Photosystem II CP43 reaction center protein [Fagus crenata]